MNGLKKNVLEDYDYLMYFGHNDIEDLKEDLNNLKIRDRIDELQKENTELKKQEGIIVFEGALTLGGDNGLAKYAGKKGKLIFKEDKEE